MVRYPTVWQNERLFSLAKAKNSVYLRNERKNLFCETSVASETMDFEASGANKLNLKPKLN